MLWHKLPKSIYFRRGSIVEAMKDLAGKRRALLVTDRFLFQNGLADEPIRLLKQAGIEVEDLRRRRGRSDADRGAQGRRARRRLQAGRHRRLRRRLADGRGEDHLGDVRAPGSSLRGSGAALHGHPQAHLQVPEDGREGRDGGDPDHVGHRLGSHAVRGGDRRRQGHEVSARRLRADSDHGRHRRQFRAQPAQVAHRLRRHRRGDPCARGLRLGDGQRVLRRTGVAGAEAAQGAPAGRLYRRRDQRRGAREGA